MDDLKDVILYHMRRDVMLSTLRKGTRYDGRPFDEYREIKIEYGPIKTAEGSAIAHIGNTKVLAAAKFEVVKPFADRPDEGVLTVNSEFLPTASAQFESGPPDENSIELARVVDRGIRSAESVDLKSFFIEEEKVLGLFLDIFVLDHAGNLFDAAALAAIACLKNTRMPKIEEGEIVRKEFTGPLKLKNYPVATTLAKIADYWLVDPSLDEDKVADSLITITTVEGHVCSMQKREGALTKEELLDCIDIAFKKGNKIRSILERD